MDTPESIARDLVEDPMCSVCETSMEIAIVDALKRQRAACAEAVKSCEGMETKNRVRKDEAMGACLLATEGL